MKPRPDPPRPPGRGVLVSLELMAFGILLFQVFRSEEPSSFKLGVGGLLFLALYTAAVFFIGRRYEWYRLLSRRRSRD